MPPSRPGTSSGSTCTHLLVILTLAMFLSFLPPRDTLAGGLPKGPSSVSLPDIGSLDTAQVGPFHIGGRVYRIHPELPRLDPEGSHMRPFTPRKVLDRTASPALWLGDGLMDRINREIPDMSPVKTNPLLLPFRSEESTVIVRRRAWSPSSTPEDVIPVKPRLSAATFYFTSSEEKSGHLAMDVLLPKRIGGTSLLFLESRAEYKAPFSRIPSWADHRFDLGLGLGLRKVWDDKVMLGANGFLDSSRLDGDWYSSPGFGLELAWTALGGALDITLNSYRGGGIDLQGGFTFPILDKNLDMRLYAEKYRFFDGEFILGSKGGVEVSSPGRTVAVSYEYGQDSRNPEYHAIGCSLTVPFCLEKVFSGRNPFEMPEPTGRAARYAQHIQSDRVKRTWSSPNTVVEARNTSQGKRWATPGRLNDSLFWSKTPETANAGPEKADSNTCTCRETKRCCKCCECEREKNTCDDRTRGSSSSMSTLWAAICAAGATYLAGDYAYRNAFGPFELEPHEVTRIRQEMPSKRSRK